jgi:hypothetical protein
MAQFFDVVFKDIRSIGEVIMWYTQKEWKYTGTYDFQKSRLKSISEFATSQWLQTFSSLTKKLYSEIATAHQSELAQFQKTKKPSDAPKITSQKDETLFWFVASYKIDAKWNSLWKWFIDIPAWQVSKVDGKELTVTDPTDKAFIANRFAQSEYGKATWENLKKMINEKNLLIDIDKLDFKTVLTTWTIYSSWGQKITLDTDFVAFLYWQCANESMWLRLKWITIEWFNEESTIDLRAVSVDELCAIQANTTNTVGWASKRVGLWVAWWSKKEETTPPLTKPPEKPKTSGTSTAWTWEYQKPTDWVVIIPSIPNTPPVDQVVSNPIVSVPPSPTNIVWWDLDL